MSKYNKDKKREYYLNHKDEYIRRDRKRKLEHADDIRNYHKNYYIKYRLKLLNLRTELVNFLGGRCSNPECLIIGGCTDNRCLQIDHIDGGGTKEINNMGYKNMIKYYLDNPNEAKKKLQILCANCNWIKIHINNERYK